MTLKHPRTPALIAAGALSLAFALVAPTAAFAGYDDPQWDDVNRCATIIGGMCTNVEYTEDNRSVAYGDTVRVSDDGRTCPGAGSASSVSAINSKTITRSQSWTVGVGVDFKISEMISVGASATYGESVARSVTTGTAHTEAIPEGKAGYMAFTPKMYHSEGTVTWKEWNSSSWGSISPRNLQLFAARVSSDTPVATGGSQSSGLYHVVTRDLTTEELGMCPSPTPPTGVDPIKRDPFWPWRF